MVKIKESKQPERIGMEYLRTVEESISQLQDFHSRKSKALNESDLAHECKENYGSTWTYDPNLDACIDDCMTAVNPLLKREGNEITLNINTHTWSDPNFRGQWGTPIQSDATLQDYTQSSGNTNVLTGNSPGDYQMRSGWNYTQSTDGFSNTAKREKKTLIHIKA